MVSHLAPRAQRRSGWRLAAIAPLVLALAIAGPASAKPSASGTLSSAGGKRYVLTVTNTGAEPFEIFGVAASVTKLVPSPPCENRGASFVCSGTIAPGASRQVCFNASLLGAYPSVQVTAGSLGPAQEAIFETTSGPALSSCPVVGGRSGSSGGSRWAPAHCKSAYKAWRKRHGRANAEQRLRESRALSRQHGCKLARSILK